MLLCFGAFIAGCLAGAFLTVWAVAIPCAVALVCALVAYLSGAMTFSAILWFFVAPVVFLQSGFVVAFLVRGALTAPSHQATVDADTKKEVEIGRGG